MGMSGEGPRDWSPSEASGVRISAPAFPSAWSDESPVRTPPTTRGRGARSRGWGAAAGLVLASATLAASFFDVTHIGPFALLGMLFAAPLSLAVSAASLRAARRARSGRSDIAAIAVGFSVVAALILAARIVTGLSFPAAESLVPTIALGSHPIPTAVPYAPAAGRAPAAGAQDAGAAAAGGDVISVQGTGSAASPQDLSGTASVRITMHVLAYLLTDNTPFTPADGTTLRLADGEITDGAQVHVAAPHVTRMAIVYADAAHSSVSVTLWGDAGDVATYDSRTGVESYQP